MAIGLLASIRNARLDLIKTAIDAGSGAGKLRIYNGSRPATGGTVTTLLAELTFTDPSAPAASGGVLTFSAITSDTSADNTGTATWARAVDSANTFVCDMSVGTVGSGADIEMNLVTIEAGGTVSVTSAVITEGNP